MPMRKGDGMDNKTREAGGADGDDQERRQAGCLPDFRDAIKAPGNGSLDRLKLKWWMLVSWNRSKPLAASQIGIDLSFYRRQQSSGALP
jgi:hypothetical protein